MTKVHRVRYYNPKPEPINNVALNKTNKQIAIARCDGSIEIWDLNHAPYLTKFIPGVEKGSIEAIGWVQERLFVTGLSGALIEWDLNEVVIKNTVVVTGYAAWCLDVSPDETLLAVGTEQGYVNVYDVETDEIRYLRLFDKQEGRILCCKFNMIGTTLVTGSFNTIRVWHVESGHAISRINLSRRGKEVIVWCLHVLADNTIVSGDSLGRLTFWNGTLGEQIESYSTHRADVLAIAVSEDEKSLFCSGVDPLIVNFVKVDQNGSKLQAHWVKNVQRYIHEHDVRGLEIYNDKLISVGIDGYLTFSSYPPKWVMRIPPIINTPRTSICPQKQLLLLRFSNFIEVWKLGTYSEENIGEATLLSAPQRALTAPQYGMSNLDGAETDSEDEAAMEQLNTSIENDTPSDVINKAQEQNITKQRLQLVDQPVKIAAIQTRQSKQIRCCAFSLNGELIVYSTDTDVRMVKLGMDDDLSNVSLSKLKINGLLEGGYDRLAFTDDSRTLIAHSSGVLQIMQVDPEVGATHIQSITFDKYLKAKSLLHLISKDGASGVTYLVAADTLGSIAVWTHTGKKFEFYVALPTYQCLPSALTIDTERDNLIIVYVDQKIVEYELKEKKFTEWPGAALPPEWRARTSCVLGVTPHTGRDAVVFHDDTSVWILERSAPEQDQNQKQDAAGPAPKKKAKADDSNNLSFKIIPTKYLADFHWVGKDEAVLVEVLPESIVSQLPPMSAVKRRPRV